MPRNRVSYPCQFLLVGPSPASGYHFVDYTGLLNDDYDSLILNHNLLKQINRVQNVGISIETNRTEIKQLGTRTILSRPTINAPKITIDFEYLVYGLINEARLGFNVNYAQFQYPYTGEPYYSDNFNVNLLSGFMARQFTQPTTEPYWPYPMRDCRNIFLVRAREFQELQILGEHRFDVPDTTQGIDPEATGYEVMALGNCYIDSYETSASVNDLIRAKVTYTCDSADFHLSGSGCYIPAINTQTRQPIRNNHFVIPEIREEGGAHVLLPGDVTVSFVPSGFSDFTGLGIGFSDMKIQDYSIGINFNRESLESLGYKCPIDRKVTYPVYASLQFGILMGDCQSGNFLDTLNLDSGYNITIKVKNPPNSPFPVYSEYTISQNPRHDGPSYGHSDIALRYDFRGAKFDNIAYNSEIGINKKAILNFSLNLDPDNLQEGLFISGLLNVEKLSNYLIDESGYYILDEVNKPIAIDYPPVY